MLAALGPARTADAQACGSIRLDSQSAVDAFACSTVNRLDIGPLSPTGDPTDITSLAPLAGLVEVSTVLTIRDNPQLTSLQGLENLVAVGEGLAISNNFMLTDLAGLGAVAETRDFVQVTGNDNLVSLSGLSGLQRTAILSITDNEVLQNIDDLASLTEISLGVVISNNPSLENVSGLSNAGRSASPPPGSPFLSVLGSGSLATLGGLEGLYAGDVTIRFNASLTTLGDMDASQLRSLTVDGNPALVSLGTVGSVETLSNDILIRANPSLVDLGSLAALAEARSLVIADNDALTDLDELRSLGRLTTGSLTIQGNAFLENIDGLSSLGGVGGGVQVDLNPRLGSCSCGLYGLLTSGYVGGSVVIGFNEDGCMSVDDVTAAFPQNCPFPVDGEDTPEAGAFALAVGPNPGALAVEIRAVLPRPGPARIAVYDLAGRLVGVAHEGQTGSDVSLSLDVSSLAPGVYVARLEAEGRAESVAFTVAR